MAKYTFGEIAINQMNNRRKLEEEQKQFNEKMAEETRQANLLTAFRNQQIEIDRQRNAIMEQNNANENIYKQGMLANDTAITNYNLQKPYEVGDYATGGIFGNKMTRVKEATPKDTYEQATTFQDTDGTWKTRAFNKATRQWETIGDVKPTGTKQLNGYGYNDKSKATIAKNLDRLKVFSDNLTKQAEEKEIVYTTVDNKGNTLETIMPKSEYRSKAQGLLKQTMAEAGVPMSGKVIYTIKKSIQNYDNLSADEKIKEVDDAVGDLVKNRIIDETQGELARQWIRVTTR